jgi:hypothetical protein
MQSSRWPPAWPRKPFDTSGKSPAHIHDPLILQNALWPVRPALSGAIALACAWRTIAHAACQRSNARARGDIDRRNPSNQSCRSSAVNTPVVRIVHRSSRSRAWRTPDGGRVGVPQMRALPDHDGASVLCRQVQKSPALPRAREGVYSSIGEPAMRRTEIP